MYKEIKCTLCSGKGKLVENIYRGKYLITKMKEIICPICKGTGKRLIPIGNK